MAELTAVEQRRELTRQTLEMSLQRQTEAVQKRAAVPHLRMRIEQKTSWPKRL